MSLKFAVELYVMTTNKNAKCEGELTCRFLIDMSSLTNFDLNTQKSQKFSLSWTPFEQIILCLS